MCLGRDDAKNWGELGDCTYVRGEFIYERDSGGEEGMFDGGDGRGMNQPLE